MKFPSTKRFKEHMAKRPKLPVRTKQLAIGKDPCQVYLDTLKESGCRSMGIMLTRVSELYGYKDIQCMPWEHIRFEHLGWIKSTLQKVKSDQDKEYSQRSINMAIYAARGVSKAAYNLGLITIDDLTKINDVKPIKITRLPAGRAVDGDEFSALLAVCMDDERSAGARDLAIINCLYVAGLRRSEAAKLTLDNFIVRKDKKTKARQAKFHFFGKGDVEAFCHLDSEALSAVDNWIVERGPSPGPLFCSITKGGKVNTQRHMSEQSIYNIVRSRSQQAGIPLISPHDMRRSLATHLLNEKNVPIKRVQNIMRHADIRTTAIYVRDDEDENRKAINGLRSNN